MTWSLDSHKCCTACSSLRTPVQSVRELCSTRLPPASTVQAMFLYELEREKENDDAMRRLMMDDLKRRQRADDFRRARTLERVYSRKKHHGGVKKGKGSNAPGNGGRKTTKHRRNDMEVDGEAGGSSTAK